MPLGNAIYCSVPLTAGEVILRWSLLCSACTHCLLPLSTLETAWLFFIHSSLFLSYAYTLIRHHWALNFSRVNYLNSFSPLLWKRCFSLFHIFRLLHWTLSTMSMPISHRGVQNRAQYSLPVLHHQWWIKGWGHLSQSASILWLMYPRIPVLDILTFLMARAHCWLTFNLVPIRTVCFLVHCHIY